MCSACALARNICVFSRPCSFFWASSTASPCATHSMLAPRPCLLIARAFLPARTACLLHAARGYAASAPPPAGKPGPKPGPAARTGQARRVRKSPAVATRDLPTNEAIQLMQKEFAQKRAQRAQDVPDADVDALDMADRLMAKVRSAGSMPFPEYMALVNGSRPAGFQRHLADVSKYRKRDWMDLAFLRKAYGLAVAGYFHRAWLEFDQAFSLRLDEANVKTPATMIESLTGVEAEWAKYMLAHEPVEGSAPTQTRLVVTNPEEGALVSELILAMAMSPSFGSTLQQIVLVERRGLRQRVQAAVIRIAVEQALNKTVVTIPPNASVPPLKPNVVQLRWVKSLREVPQTPGLWTMLISHDYLGSLPAHMVERSDEGYRDVKLTHGTGATSFKDAATEEASRERLMLKPYGMPQEQAWPTGMFDPRLYSISIRRRALLQTGVFDAGRRIGHIISGRANISPQADAPGRPSLAVGANKYGLFAHRPRHSAQQEVTQGAQIDLRDGARDSQGGVGLVLDAMTADLRLISKGLCSVKPGKTGYADVLQTPGNADLVAPVDLAAFEAGVNAVARTASHPLMLKTFWTFQGVPKLIKHWLETRRVGGVPLSKEEVDQLVVTWRVLVNMKFRKVPYMAIGIEAPPFRVDQYLAALNGYSPVPTEVEPLEGEGTRADIAARANELPVRIPPFDRRDPLADTKRLERWKGVLLALALGGTGVAGYAGYVLLLGPRPRTRAADGTPAQTP